jgi:hypothetical protein
MSSCSCLGDQGNKKQKKTKNTSVKEEMFIRAKDTTLGTEDPSPHPS